jgi:phospholipase C
VIFGTCLGTDVGLPTMASVNHTFDVATPVGSNYEAAGGAAAGPPTPPRDGRGEIGNLIEYFAF